MNNPFIEVRDVSFEYPSDTLTHQSAIKHVSLQVRQGEFLAVLGHNGSGKSTLAKLLNGILTPTEGKVTVDGLDTAKEEDLLAIRRKVGMVFQNPDNQLVSTVVEEDVAFGPENLGVQPEEIRARVDEALKTVDLYDLKDRAPHTLSGGQKQRVAIAGVLAMRPACIVFDESTAMLDPSGRREILATIRRLNHTLSMTVILITHYMNEAVEADRVIVMNDGEIAMDDVPQKVFSEVETLWKLGLDVPQSTEILHLLSSHERVRRRMRLPRGVLDENEAADCIRALLKAQAPS